MGDGNREWDRTGGRGSLSWDMRAGVGVRWAGLDWTDVTFHSGSIDALSTYFSACSNGL